ncbi:MAG TPA: efflux transporter outer membrane subunit [Steroidobacteraceae bacterium]|nr:efflux transporter outer membrane subunit [Steroidobacteraceae bacterium]
MNKIHSILKAIPAALASALLASCAVFGPSRTPPAMNAPAQYSVAPSSAPRLAMGASPVARWWQAYSSPQLDDLVNEALEHNQSLAAATANLKAAHEQVREQVGENLVPHVDVGFSPTRQRALGIPVLPQQTFLYNVFAAEVQGSWTLDFFGASVMADRALLSQVRAQAYGLEAARRSVAFNVVLATINAASLQAQLDALTRYADAAERRSRQMRDRFESGSASHVEVLEADEAAAEAQRLLPPLHRQLLGVRHAEAVLLGRTPDQAPAPLRLEDLHLPETLPVAVPSELLHQRPDILAAEETVRASADAAGAASASLFPSLTLSAAYGRGGFDWSTFASPAGAVWSVGASLTQPLFHGGALHARARQYQDTYEASLAQYRQTVLTAFQSVADTLVALEDDAREIEQTQRSADALKTIQDEVQGRYEAGSADAYTVLGAQSQYQAAYVTYVAARAARLSDSAALLDAMGNPGVPVAGATVAMRQSAQEAKP